MQKSLVLLALAGIAGCSGEQSAEVADPADRVFTNGAVYTVDANRSWARDVAVKDGHIVYVGDDATAYIGDSTEVTDLDGQMLLPGFHDSHIHILIGVTTDKECDLLRSESAQQEADILAECTELEGFGDEGWITGGGWAEYNYPDANPQKGLLDALFPDRPVFLESTFGHAAWVNSKALEIAGIDDDTENPYGGIIERDPETGEASGTLRESAITLVRSKVPPTTLELQLESIREAQDMTHSVGITAVIEPGVDETTMNGILSFADNGELKLRTLTSLSPIGYEVAAVDEELFAYLDRREEWRRPNVDVDSVKIFIDGVIEYCTSPLTEPYEDPDCGDGSEYFFYEKDKLVDYFTRLDEMGIKIHVHAIGDAAIRQALDAFEGMRENNGMNDNRHHIVHLQLIHPDDRPRFGELNIGATFQLLWAYPGPDVVELTEPLLGTERTWQTYPAKTVHDAGGRIVGGSDYFVTDLNPLLAIETAITRQDPWTNEGDTLNIEEALDLETMIDAYTINGAWQMGLEDVQGSIEVGKRADLVVLDRNLFEIPASEISDAKVTMTIFEGQTVYE